MSRFAVIDPAKPVHDGHLTVANGNVPIHPTRGETPTVSSVQHELPEEKKNLTQSRKTVREDEERKIK